MNDLIHNLELKVAISIDQIQAVHAIRLKVFTEEQNIPEALDIDGKDDTAINLLAEIDGKSVGTGRLYPVNNHLGEIARIAVIEEFRGAGIASQIILQLELLAKDQGLKALTLWPHEKLTAFYTSLGFKVMTNQTQTVAGHSLIKMHKIIG